MRKIFVVTLFIALSCCPVLIGFSQDEYELSNVKVEYNQRSPFGDFKNFDLGSSEGGVDGNPSEFEEFAIKLLETKGFKNVVHGPTEISFVYFILGRVIKDLGGLVPFESDGMVQIFIKEGYQEGDTVLCIVIVALDNKKTAAAGYQEVDAHIWDARATAAVTPSLPYPTLDNEAEEEKILLGLYKKLFAQLIEKCLKR